MTSNINANLQKIAELNKHLADFSFRFNRTIAEGVAPAIRAQSDSALAAIESAVQHGENMVKADSPQKVAEEQTALARDLGENFRATAEELLKSQQDTGEALKSLLEEGVESFNPERLRDLFGANK